MGLEQLFVALDFKPLKLIRMWLTAPVWEPGKPMQRNKTGTQQGSLCKALHKLPYAKKVIMQSKSDNALKMSHPLFIYFA
jgi:hypothetical protein